MNPWQMETWIKTCGPYPGGLILTHTRGQRFQHVSRAGGFSDDGLCPSVQATRRVEVFYCDMVVVGDI